MCAQAYLRDSLGLVSDHRKVSHTNFWFPSVYKSDVYTVLLSVNVCSSIMSRKHYTYLIGMLLAQLLPELWSSMVAARPAPGPSPANAVALSELVQVSDLCSLNFREMEFFAFQCSHCIESYLKDSQTIERANLLLQIINQISFFNSF